MMTGSDASPSDPLPSDPEWSGGSLFVDERQSVGRFDEAMPRIIRVGTVAQSRTNFGVRNHPDRIDARASEFRRTAVPGEVIRSARAHGESTGPRFNEFIRCGCRHIHARPNTQRPSARGNIRNAIVSLFHRPVQARHAPSSTSHYTGAPHAQ